MRIFFEKGLVIFLILLSFISIMFFCVKLYESF